MKNFKKYLQLYAWMFKTSFIADMEYRVNFVIRILSDVFWYAAQVMTFEVLFQHTHKIGDWNLAQTRVFLGLVFIVNALYMILLADNFDGFSDKVRKGDLDLLLAKPVSSQFMISLQKAGTAMIGNLIIATAWLIYSLTKIPDFHWINILWLLVLVPCGLAVTYTLRFTIASTAIIFARSENLQFIWFQVYRLSMRPDSIYVPWLKWLLLTALPMGVIASVPARSLLEPADYGLFAWVIVLSCLMMYFSSKFWNFCLKFYSSASS
jgi:ABC-2 type transport system permease protein